MTRLVRNILTGLGVVVLAGAVGVVGLLLAPGPGSRIDPPVTIQIPAGASADSIAALLYHRGVVRHPSLFLLAARVLGKQDKLRAGLYELSPRLSCYRVVHVLAAGKQKLVKVTIPEGLRSWEIASLLSRRIGIDSTRFIELVQDSSLVAELAPEAPSLEGYLFPETYYFAWKTPEEEVIRTMVQHCYAALDDSIRARADSLGLTLHQVLTLASLIEGEAKIDSERALVSAVYHNRLRRGMRLEADPTVQYLLGGRPRRLLQKDLEIESPYNTYRHAGLPPGPVNSPGRKSILAALHPADVDYLFFVADGNGGHHFSRTLTEHVRYKAKLDKLRRELARKQRESNSRGRS